MYYINSSDFYVYTPEGQRLPRTQAAALLAEVGQRVSPPVSVYLFADHERGLLKVGISENIAVRQRQLEIEQGVGLELLHQTPALNRVDAGEIERSIHMFLGLLGRSSLVGQEWFTLKPHDVWLIRNLLNEMPVKAARAVFGSLCGGYIDLLNTRHLYADNAREEVRIGYGESVYYHFNKELATGN